MLHTQEWPDIMCFGSTVRQTDKAQHALQFFEGLVGTKPSWAEPIQFWLAHIARGQIPWIPQLLFVRLLVVVGPDFTLAQEHIVR